MATVSLRGVLRQIRQLARVQPAAELTDGHLLDCFLTQHDQAAFEALVIRHGPMVARVCQRVLGDLHAAEDAFQAAFLVLARKAQFIRKRSSVGGWLYEVAYHVAVRAKTQANRRQHCELEAGTMRPTASSVSLDRRETVTLVEEQLARLPEKYRTPLVLCYLEGKTQVEAAQQLGCPISSLASRLLRGRELLRSHLANRGLVLSAAGMAALLSESTASAALPAEVVLNTVRAVFAGEVPAGASAAALVLAEGFLQAMAAARRTFVVLALLCLGTFGISAGAITYGLLTAPLASHDAVTWVTASPAQPQKLEDPDLLALAVDAQGRVTAPGLSEPLTGAEPIEALLKQRFQEMKKTAQARPGATAPIELAVSVRAHPDAEYRAVLELLRQSRAAGFSKLRLPALSRPIDLTGEAPGSGVLVRAVRDGVGNGNISALIVIESDEGETAVPNLDSLEKLLKVQVADPEKQAKRNDIHVWADSSLKFGRLVDVATVCLQAGFQRLLLGTPEDDSERIAPPAPTPVKPASVKRPHGTDEAGKDAALAAGLTWLAQHQAEDGHWSMHAFHKDGKCNCTGPGGNRDIAGAALALLPLLRGGESHQGEGRHARTVERGLKFLLGKQGKDGSFHRTLYDNALAGLAVCESYGRSRDANLREPAQRALDFIVAAQHEGGGWRYQPLQAGDLSVTSWQVQALRAGHLAGLKVPDETLRKTNLFLDSVSTPDGSGYGYTGPIAAPTMTACGLLCRSWLAGDGGPLPGWSTGVGYLQKLPPDSAFRNLYFYYYATQVMNQDVATATVWNPAMRKRLIEEQEWGADPKYAHQHGSWSPAADAWGGQFGRLGQTSLAILILQATEPIAPPAPLPLKEPLPPKELDVLWTDLASGNGFRASEVIRLLVSAPAQALPLLQDRLRPVAEIDGKLAERWLMELDSETFAARQQAEEELEKLGQGIVPTLRKALADKPSLEKGQRLERILQRCEKIPLTPVQIQHLRALRVLEVVGTPDARKHLEALAQGAPGVFLTREAQNSLQRLAKRK